MAAGRPRLAAAALVAALAAAGCGGDDGGGTTTGTDTLTVYSVLPLEGPDAARGRDLVDGQKLALAAARGRVGEFTINFRSVDASDEGGESTPGSAAAAARSAAQDPSTIAAVGAPDDETATIATPLLNEAGVLLVTTGATYAGLTGTQGAVVPGEPDRFYPSGRLTLTRAVGSDLSQAPALVALAREEGCERVGVVVGRDAEDRSLAELVEAAARQRGLAVAEAETADPRSPTSPEGAGCVVVSVSDPDRAVPVLRALHALAPDVVLLAPSAVALPSVAGGLGRAGAQTRLVTPLPGARWLTPGQRRVAQRFRRTFGRPPGPGGLLGYDAMSAVLGAVGRAGEKGNDRVEVSRQALADRTRRRPPGWAAARVRDGALVAGAPLRFPALRIDAE